MTSCRSKYLPTLFLMSGIVFVAISPAFYPAGSEPAVGESARTTELSEFSVGGNGSIAEADDPDQAQRFARFERLLSGARLAGQFTVVRDRPEDEDREDQQQAQPLQEEEYTIRRIRKLDEPDMWLFEARIRYGGRDVTLPLPLKVLWAGDTPMITLTDMEIPGLGTYSARVLFHDDKYAGTWSGGRMGGHMFGRIIKADASGE